MQDLSTEYARTLSNGVANLISGFGQAMRSGELNNFQDGDIFTLPELDVVTLEDGKSTKLVNKATGKEVVIKEPMMRNGEPTGRDLTYMLVEVNRNGAKAIARFFPSMMWKRRRVVKNTGSEDAPVWEATDQYKQASGSVIDFARKYATVDQAILEMSKQGKGIKVTIDRFPTFEYQTTNKTDDSVCTLEWA